MGNTPALHLHSDPSKAKTCNRVNGYHGYSRSTGQPPLFCQDTWSFARPENKVFPNVIPNGVLRSGSQSQSNPEGMHINNSSKQGSWKGLQTDHSCNIMAESPTRNVILITNKENIVHYSFNLGISKEIDSFQSGYHDNSLSMKNHKKHKAPPAPSTRSTSLVLSNSHLFRRPSEFLHTSSRADSACKRNSRKKRCAPKPPASVKKKISNGSIKNNVDNMQEMEALFHLTTPNKSDTEYDNTGARFMDVDDEKELSVEKKLNNKNSKELLHKLNLSIKKNIKSAAQERAKKSSDILVNPKSKHQIFKEELQRAVHSSLKRRSDSKLEPKTGSQTIYKAKQVTNSDKESQQKDAEIEKQGAEVRNGQMVINGHVGGDWIPDQDLDGDLLDGPEFESEITARGTNVPNDFNRLVDRRYDYDKSDHQCQHNKKKGKQGSLHKIKKSVQNAIGSLGKASGKILQRKSVDEIFNGDSKGKSGDLTSHPAVQVNDKDQCPAYAYHPGKGQLFLLPDQENVFITKDGRVISESSLEKKSFGRRRYISAAQKREKDLLEMKKKRKQLIEKEADIKTEGKTGKKHDLVNGDLRHLLANGVMDSKDGVLHSTSSDTQSGDEEDEDVVQLHAFLTEKLEKRRAKISMDKEAEGDYEPSWMEVNGNAKKPTRKVKQKGNRACAQKKGTDLDVFAMYCGDIGKPDPLGQSSGDEGVRFSMNEQFQKMNSAGMKTSSSSQDFPCSDSLEDSRYRSEHTNTSLSFIGYPNLTTVPGIQTNIIHQPTTAVASPQSLHPLGSPVPSISMIPSACCVCGNTVLPPSGLNMSVPLMPTPGFQYSPFTMPASLVNTTPWQMNFVPTHFTATSPVTAPVSPSTSSQPQPGPPSTQPSSPSSSSTSVSSPSVPQAPRLIPWSLSQTADIGVDTCTASTSIVSTPTATTLSDTKAAGNSKDTVPSTVTVDTTPISHFSSPENNHFCALLTKQQCIGPVGYCQMNFNPMTKFDPLTLPQYGSSSTADKHNSADLEAVPKLHLDSTSKVPPVIEGQEEYRLVMQAFDEITQDMEDKNRVLNQMKPVSVLPSVVEGITAL